MEYSKSGASLQAYLEALPHSQAEHPETLLGTLKAHFWRWYTPRHASFRDTLLSLKLIRHKSRQRYTLGKIAPRVSMQEFISYLVSRGYGNHFIAWQDVGEVVSLRLVDGEFQYHMRVFEDGEVRGHYEYTPESHPFRHLKKTGMADRREEFMSLLGDMIVPKQ